MKQRLSELRQVAGGGFLYGARDLIAIKTSPQSAFRPLFYGESLALVSLLLDCGSREQLLQFVETSQTEGFDAALRDVYGDRRLAEFERRFNSCVMTDRPLARLVRMSSPRRFARGRRRPRNKGLLFDLTVSD